MKVWARRYNLYLMLALAIACVPGCKSNKPEKQLSTLRVHMETPNVGDPTRLDTVSVVRSNPVSITIERAPVLTEANLLAAKIIETSGGFAIQVKFDGNGTWLLEQSSAGNPGRHFVIFSLWGDTPAQSRWLAAPMITHRIANGTLTFTPDASREEGDRIVLCLNNAAKKAKGVSE